MPSNTTDQEAFNIVKKHLLTQKVKAIGEDHICRLKLDTLHNGTLKCAVGALIPDDDYSPRLENVGLATLKRLYLPNVTYQLLADLQAMHDCGDPKEWSRLLVNIGRRYNLNVE